MKQRRNFLSAVALALLAVALPASAAEDIVIGQVAPFSGPQAVTGKAIHAGAKLYFDAVNARGGVRGRRIQYTALPPPHLESGWRTLPSGIFGGNVSTYYAFIIIPDKNWTCYACA